MFGLRNELFGFPVNSCDYEAIDCNKSYIPILNRDNDNEFVWSLWDPLEWGIDAANVSFSTKDIQKWPASVTKVDQALDALVDMIDASKSTIESFTFALNQDWETLEWTITYEDDSWRTYDKKASINLKRIVEWRETITLWDITANSITANEATFWTFTVTDAFTFEAPVTMNSTLEVNWKVTATAWVDVTWWTTTDTLTVTDDASVWWDLTVTWDWSIWWDLTVTWDETIWGNQTITWNQTVTWNQTISGTTTLNWPVSINDDVTIADDLTVNWTTHLTDLETTQSVDIGGTLRVDWAINGWNWMTITGQVESDTVRTGELIADEIRVQEGIYLSAWAEAPDFVLQAEKGQPNGVCPLNASWKVDPQYLPDVFTTAIVKVGTGIFSNSNTSVVVDSSITADSFVIISNYSDIIWDLNEVINVWQLTVVSNQTETGSYKYIIVNPLPVNP